MARLIELGGGKSASKSAIMGQAFHCLSFPEMRPATNAFKAQTDELRTTRGTRHTIENAIALDDRFYAIELIFIWLQRTGISGIYVYASTPPASILCCLGTPPRANKVRKPLLGLGDEHSPKVDLPTLQLLERLLDPGLGHGEGLYDRLDLV